MFEDPAREWEKLLAACDTFPYRKRLAEKWRQKHRMISDFPLFRIAPD